MGVRTDYLHERDKDFFKARNDYFVIMIDRLTKFFKMNDTLFSFTSKYSHYKNVSKYLGEFAEEMIRLRRSNKGKVDEYGSFSFIDFCENSKNFTETQIRDNVNLFIVAVSATC